MSMLLGTTLCAVSISWGVERWWITQEEFEIRERHAEGAIVDVDRERALRRRETALSTWVLLTALSAASIGWWMDRQKLASKAAEAEKTAWFLSFQERQKRLLDQAERIQ
jgi:hypothetical protein